MRSCNPGSGVLGLPDSEVFERVERRPGEIVVDPYKGGLGPSAKTLRFFLKGAVRFEQRYESPFFMPLDTGRDSFDREYVLPSGIGYVDWRCPLCYNELHARLDAQIIGGASVYELSRQYGFSVDRFREHLSLHIGPIYVEIAKRICDLISFADDKAGTRFFRSLLKNTPSPQMEYATYHDNRGSAGDRAASRGYMVRYAFRGGDRIMDSDGRSRELVPFNRGQCARETQERGIDALNYYDELLNIRQRAIDVYDKIINTDDRKRFSVAIAAVREMRGVVDTLARTSLIARQLSEGIEGAPKLFPDLQALVDAIRSTPVGAARPSADEALKEDILRDADRREEDIILHDARDVTGSADEAEG